MDLLYGFEGPDHDFEIGDFPLIAPFDHVDTIDENTIHFGFEFEHGAGTTIKHPDGTAIVFGIESE